MAVPVSGRLRSLLAVLAVAAGTPVSSERLTAGVWGDRPPAEPRRALQVYVNRLRGLLGAGAIATRPYGYALEIDPDDVDVLAFDRLADRAAGTPAGERLALVERALGLWTGEPFEAVPAEPLHEVDAPRLLERRLRLVEERCDLRMRRDGPEQAAALIAELNALTARYPLREPLWERLLTVLAEAGRGAEALERYDDLRRHLADELGTDPGPALRTLYARLLDNGGAVSRVPQQLLPDLPSFTGRAALLGRLDELLGVRPDGAPPVVAITGLGGTGKTALATHWAHRQRDRFPDGRLYVDLHGFSSQAPLEPTSALEVLLRGLGVATEMLPEGVSERSALLRTELSDRRALVILDNARDADQVRPLLPGSSAHAIITSRNQLRGLTAREGVRPLPLAPFDEAEALALLRSTLGAARGAREPDAASEIVELCGRLPLAVAIIAERAARVPTVPLAEVAADLRDERQRLERLSAGDDERSDLRAVFELSYGILGADTASLFRLLSLLPDGSFDDASAGALAGRSRSDAATMLDGLVGSHLVQQPASGRYRLHDLVRAYAAERRAKQDGDRPSDLAVARAAEWVLAGLNAAVSAVRPGQPVLGPPRDPGSGGAPTGPPPRTFGTFAAAVDWFRDERSTLTGWVQRAAERGLYDHAWRLAVRLCPLLEITEQRVAAAALADVAVASARSVEGPEATYVSGHCAGRSYLRTRRLEAADDTLAAGLAAAREAGHRAAEAALMSEAGAVRRIAGDVDEALRLQEEALILVRQDVDPRDGSLLRVSEADVLANVGACHYHRHDFDRAIAATRSALDSARDAGERWREAVCLNNLTVMLEVVGDYEAAAHSYAEAVALSADLEAPTLVFDAHTARGRILAHEGDTAAAVRVWEHALSLLPATENPIRTEVLGLLRDAGRHHETPTGTAARVAATADVRVPCDRGPQRHREDRP